MNEARSLQYSINISANTGQAESNIRNLTSSLGSLEDNRANIKVSADTSSAEINLQNITGNLGSIKSEATSISSAFRSAFISGIDSGKSFSTSIRAGIGGAFSYVGVKATEFRNQISSVSQGIKDAFSSPVQTIKQGLGGAIQSTREKFINLARGSKQASDEISESINNAKRSVSSLGDSAEKTSSKMDKLIGGLKGAGVTIAALSTAAIAGATALGSAVISSYADYEQLVGGVDTLFKDASQDVQDFAARGFQTAGLSTNRYMELVTSFSSSLIQSLGGNTKEAAQAADIAITDMADNSNKMGTSLELIQNAYRGFSMQNYTMLDNLKLGYGGTRDEMQRLLTDAEKISGVKYDISNFADITKAIHVIQTEIGITGTTAEEAAKTISGSWLSTKAAFQNLITGIGRSDADIGKLAENVIKSFGNVITNVVPVVENIVHAMPVLVDALIPTISDVFPRLFGIIGNLFGETVSVLFKLLPTITPSILNGISKIAEAVISYSPKIINVGISITSALITGVGKSIPTLLPILSSGLGLMIKELFVNAPQLLKAGGELLKSLADGIFEALPIATKQIPEIVVSIMGALIESLPIIAEVGVSLIWKISTGIINALPDLIMILPNIITGIVEYFISAMEPIVEQGVNVVSQFASGILQSVGIAVAPVSQIISAVASAFNSFISSFNEIGRNIIQGVWDGMSSMGSWIKEKSTGFFGGVVDNVKNVLGIHSPSRVFAEIGNNMALGLDEGFSKTMVSVDKNITEAIPNKFDLPQISYKVNAENVPVLGDMTYGVNPIINDIKLPNMESDFNLMTAGAKSFSTETKNEIHFYPTINVNIEGNTGQDMLEEATHSFREAVKELYEEFREEELSRQTLKNQFAF